MMAVNDPISGPMPRDQFRELVDAPFGAATKAIRKYDPQFGRADGEKFRWRVHAESTMRGSAYVMASSQEEADDLAADLDCNDFDWCDYSSDFDVLEVEPHE
jgi:hypothetical protein